jgi:hypothetical protein
LHQIPQNWRGLQELPWYQSKKTQVLQKNSSQYHWWIWMQKSSTK